MSTSDAAIAKLQELPDSLAGEVSDFIDFLLMKKDRTRWKMWEYFAEAVELAEAGMDDYLADLEDYEERLARGEIRW